jgi:hypothetical protein
MGVCILLCVYQIKSLDKPSFATSIVRVFYFMQSFMFTTCFGPEIFTLTTAFAYYRNIDPADPLK